MTRIHSKSPVWPGRPYPLGASWDGGGVNFALFSANAHHVELCQYDRGGTREIDRVILPEHTDGVWHGYLPTGRPGMLYGYRVYGPYEPERGHRFNPHKLLIDPYAKALSGPLRWSDAHFGYRLNAPREDLGFDRRDNARGMPKCRVVDDAFTWGDDRPPDTPWDRTVVYEAHVRGLTQLNTRLPAALRGTIAGLGMPAVIDHLVKLGITALELLPVHAFLQDRMFLERGLSNYWGYNTMCYFAPEIGYLATGLPSEFKTMVRALHAAGIEVILDVVYNHTSEGNHLGPTLSFRGIDNASYYRLVPGNERYYIDETGCGNTLNLSHPRVNQMVLDSLRYWVSEMHVDGFRFDLAATIGREPYGFDPNGGFMDAIQQDPVLQRTKLIAEPWDVGPGGYQLGNFPAGWAEWNDRYRDCVRAFWRGDPGKLGEFAGRISGSSDLFERRGRRSWASVNFVASHDGFTLNDTVSYNDRHNLANGENNADGHDHNLSDNHGAEGPTTNPAIIAARERQKRNFLATLLLSQGTPMLLAGDEMGRTQQGNNNAYCQDNEISWLDWDGLGERDRDLLAFTRRLIRLRRDHPVFRRPRFLHGTFKSSEGVPDIAWFGADGKPARPETWGSRRVIMMLNGRAGPYLTADGRAETDDVFLLLFNAERTPALFHLPQVPGVGGWHRVLDTAAPGLRSDSRVHLPGRGLRIEERSMMLLQDGRGTPA
ncbi:MAG: glycogen debranching protein GlgX [Rhodospirillaceae bacterium]|nr:glycogen debranching protein GlgX [Rhodospirillaceae bacterium]